MVKARRGEEKSKGLINQVRLGQLKLNLQVTKALRRGILSGEGS